MIPELEEEHRQIERVIDAAESALSPFNRTQLVQALDYFTAIVHRLHHAKEEEILFPEVLTRSPELARGPVLALRREHEICDAYVSAALGSINAADADDPDVRDRLTRSVRNYCKVLREHLQKEEAFFYTLAERLLPPSVLGELAERGAALRRARLSDEAYEMYEKIAKEPLADHTIALRRSRQRPQADASRADDAPVEAVLDARTLQDPDKDRSDTRDRIIISGKIGGTVYDKGGHKNLLLHDFGRGLAVQANQFLIIHDNYGMILDPGGPKVYPHVLAETKLRLGDGVLKYIFLSHQDPDIGTSLNAWLMDTKATAFVSKLWMRFLPHFGIDKLLDEHLTPIPDEGMVIDLAGAELLAIPAHFLHSCGNFQLYDSTSKVLFSGDLGASLGMDYTVVEDFEDHVRYMAGFHKRYMGSQRALSAWAKTARRLDIEIIAPQHGALFVGKQNVERFIQWCESTPCGIDLMEDGFEIPTRS